MKHLGLLGLVVGGLFFIVLITPAAAQDSVDPLNLKFFDTKLQLIQEKNIFDQNFSGVVDFSMIDLGEDGINEILVSYGYNDFPSVKIFRSDSSLINEWHPYAKGFEGKINVAAADLDNDKKDEIITAPGEGGGPHVRIFDGYGQEELAFMATDKNYRQGVDIAVGDVNGDGQVEIVTSLMENGKNVIKFFNNKGEGILNPIIIDKPEVLEPLTVFAYDLNNDKKAEIIVGSSLGSSPLVSAYDFEGKLLVSFLAYADSFRGGVEVAAANFNDENLIVTAAGFGGGPHLRFFTLSGESRLSDKFFVYNENFRGGVNVAIGNFGSGPQIVVSPQTFVRDIALTKYAKVIRVNLTDQRLYALDRGKLVKTFLISSGKKGFDTPLGTFSVFLKRPLVRMTGFYGPGNPQNYDLPNVPNVLSFKGPYTLHGAYWHHNWGHVMSHGCVNISVPLSKWLYDWTPLNTPVVIEK